MKPKERLKQQKKYVQYMDNGEMSIIHKWNEEARNEYYNNFINLI